MVGIKVGLSEQILKCLLIHALGIVSVTQGVPLGDSNTKQSISDKRNMVLSWHFEGAESPLNGPKPLVCSKWSLLSIELRRC